MHQNIQPRKMTLILDLDETLVHSRCVQAPLRTHHSYFHLVVHRPQARMTNATSRGCSVKPMVNYDWQVHVPTTGEQRGSTFFVAVRPHTAMFLRAVSKWYEVVVFTASLQHYADPVIDLIDTDGCVSRRFFRSACKVQHGNFLKDITAVRADLSQVVLVDNSPIAYSLQVLACSLRLDCLSVRLPPDCQVQPCSTPPCRCCECTSRRHACTFVTIRWCVAGGKRRANLDVDRRPQR